MRKVVLGKTGLQVSRLGFGGIPIQRVSEADAVKAIHAAFDAGVNFIDTAAAYGDSQAKIGAAIAGRDRSSLVIASKSGSNTRDGILNDIQRGLDALGSEYIDLYQLHGISHEKRWEQVRSEGGALQGLFEARERGLIRHIGFSSHSLDFALKLVEEDVFETVQFPFNLVTREPADSLIPRCRERGLGFIVMKPLCGGQYTNARLAFKFLNAWPDLVPIPGIERPEEVIEAAALTSEGEVLKGAEQAEAEAIAAKLGKRFCRRCGYCEPCPQGVPIQQCMVFDSFVARFTRERLAGGPARSVADKAPACIECGECETKCPYELPIMDTVKQALAKARKAIDG